MSAETSIIVAPAMKLDLFSISQVMEQNKVAVMERCALLGKVTGLATKQQAVDAQKELKRISAGVERARKDAKEPLLQAGRQLDTACAGFVLDVDREFGRISELVREFDDGERRRVAEEERLQREELSRIEREKQAEIERLAQEQREREAEAQRIQAEAQRKAQEAVEAAARLEREATNKRQREAAEKASAEAVKVAEAAKLEQLKLDAAMAEQRAAVLAKTAAIEERASDAAYVAAKPVEITKIAGQRTTVDWEITSINEHQLYRARPDLATKINFDMRALKAELSKGVKLAGVTAREIYKADVRLSPSRTVDV